MSESASVKVLAAEVRVLQVGSAGFQPSGLRRMRVLSAAATISPLPEA
jgi:hypothetical protein